MPTTTPLTDAINALTTYANTVTGASDTTLSDAVATLADGYGGGGGVSVDGIANGTEPSGAVTLSSATSIKAYAFYKCPITSISAPNVTSIDGKAFEGTSITELNDPFPSMVPSASTLLNTTSGYIFGNMQYLERVYLLNTGSWCVRLDTFRGCDNLKVLRLPNQNAGAEQRSAYGLTKLKIVDWGSTTSIHLNTFYGCTVFQTLILRNTSVTTLNNINAFQNTPFRGQGGLTGTVYCPNSLISSYKTANNWSTLFSGGYVTFTALEGSPYEQIDWNDSAFLQ